MGKYGDNMSHGYNSNYKPKADTIKNSFNNSNTYSDYTKFKNDSLNDLHRWVNEFKEGLELYVEQKYLYEIEKIQQNENEDNRREMKLEVSDSKGFLEDMRKAFDWYENNFDNEPHEYTDFIKYYSIELKRLKKLKKYLSYRVRSLAGKRMYNETSKDLLKYLRIRIDAINILFNPKYNERTPLHIIYGINIEGDSENDYISKLNRNKIFYPYD